MSNIVLYKKNADVERAISTINTCILLIGVYNEYESSNYNFLFNRIKGIIQTYAYDEISLINDSGADDIIHYAIHICFELLSLIDLEPKSDIGMKNIENNLKLIRESIENYCN